MQENFTATAFEGLNLRFTYLQISSICYKICGRIPPKYPVLDSVLVKKAGQAAAPDLGHLAPHTHTRIHTHRRGGARESTNHCN